MSARNEHRPGYKKTKAGWIPKEWDCMPLARAGTWHGGGTPPKHNSKFWDNGSIPWASSQDIKEPILRTTTYTISDLAVQKSSTTLIPNNSLVMVTRSGILRHTFPVAKTIFPVAINQDLKALIPYDATDINYLFNVVCFAGSDILKTCSKAGTTVESVEFEWLKKHFIPLPDLSEQKQIAEVLSIWDQAIEKTQKLIDAKQQQKKSLMQQLLTGRMRFPEFGKPVREHDEIPKGWKPCRLGDCFDERNESAPNLPLLSITSDRGVIYRDEVERKDTSNADKSLYKRITPGDIGYNTMRMWQGVSAVSTLEGIISPAYTVCVPRKGYSSAYFGYLFKYPPMVHLFHRYSQGLVDDTLNLKYHHFSLIKVCVPGEKEQNRIAIALSKCDREIEMLRQKELLLREQKKGLMQKLLTGEVRVNVKRGIR